MSGSQILKDALQGKTTPRAPWVPFVGSHGGKLIGVSAENYLKSKNNIVSGLAKAVELYKPDGLPVVFDLQLEAEVLGCELKWSNDGPPSVKSHPLASSGDWSIEQLPEFSLKQGRWPEVMSAASQVVANHPQVSFYGLLCGPFTLALHLLGNDIFLEMYDEPEKVQALILKCADIGKQVADAYLKAGCEIIAVVDPMVSQISPEHFAEFVSPALNEIFDSVREQEALSSLFVCGDTTRNLEAMCKTSCDNISIDENVDLQALCNLARKHGKSVGGNIKLTLALLMGSEDDVRLDAIRCLDVGAHQGFILSPGCDLAYDVPSENVVAAGEMAIDALALAKARTHSMASDNFVGVDEIELPDYIHEKKVIIDLITLDSLTCAPCQYMKDAADRAALTANGPVEVREHKVREREGIGMLLKLGVSNIPTMCIDGKQAYISVIPDQNTLVANLDDHLKAKGLLG